MLEDYPIWKDINALIYADFKTEQHASIRKDNKKRQTLGTGIILEADRICSRITLTYRQSTVAKHRQV